MTSPRSRANDSNNATDNGAADGWIQTALREYEQIASLCNAQSHLGNAAAAAAPAARADGRAVGDLEPKGLTAELHRRRLYGHLSGYRDGIDAVRSTRASLRAQLDAVREGDAVRTGPEYHHGDRGQRQNNRRPPPMAEAFSRHVELSERVVRTVMQSSPGQCGVLFENGMVRTSSAGDHEVNIVALASLRASVSRLKANFGES